MTPDEQDLHDRAKTRELCSTCIVRLFEIMGQLQAILDIVRAIDVPELSSYVHVSKLPTQQPNKDGYYGVVIDDGKRVDPRTVLPTFTPNTKPVKTKGDPLAELAAQLSPQDREKLIAAMESKK